MMVRADSTLDNTSGTISAARNAAVSADSLTNAAGQISGDSVALAAGALDSHGGRIVAVHDLAITSQHDATNASGVIGSQQGRATLHLGGTLDNAQGTITGAGATSYRCGTRRQRRRYDHERGRHVDRDGRARQLGGHRQRRPAHERERGRADQCERSNRRRYRIDHGTDDRHARREDRWHAQRDRFGRWRAEKCGRRDRIATRRCLDTRGRHVREFTGTCDDRGHDIDRCGQRRQCVRHDRRRPYREPEDGHA